MIYRNKNYSAFYVGEPFNPSALGAHATRDYCHYSMLRAWKGADATFPFNDAHTATYNVRDGSDWELTLKPRLRERLRHSKNIVLFLSSVTKSSRALREEMDYGINVQELPVIVIYPDFTTKEVLLTNRLLRQSAKSLWDRLPIFRDSMHKVPTIHIPWNKADTKRALSDPNFMLSTKTTPGVYVYP